MSRISLVEWEASKLPKEALSEAEALSLDKEYRSHFDVKPPSVLTGHVWDICPKGIAGVIPLGPDTVFHIQPKVPLSNLFGMMETAYGFKGKFLQGLTGLDAMEDLYSKLASLLAAKALERSRKGLFRDYLSRGDDLAAVRGRLDFARLSSRPAAVRLPCRFDEHTADVRENRLVAWTLALLMGHFLSTKDEELKPRLRKAFHAYCGRAELVPCTGRDCLSVVYNRLNDDYRPLHALCRFFLENCGPSLREGERKMLPFLMDMDLLFESFVAEWLKKNLPTGWRLSLQKEVNLSEDGWIQGRIDMVLYEGGTMKAVLDTKYKITDKPSTEDFNQVVVYALSQGVTEAILIYPFLPKGQSCTKVKSGINVRMLGFPLDGDLNEAGRVLLRGFELETFV
jgi:5-methylcytosine-specific restriction enzyme subunit McrC